MSRPISREMTKAPVRIASTVAIEEAREVMRAWGMRHLPVTNELDQLVGILSDRDFSRLFGSNLNGKSPVSEIMTVRPYSSFPESSLHEVVKEMASTKIGCTVVINHRQEVVGIFTTTDAMKILEKMLDDDDDGSYRTLKISDYLFSHQSA